MTMAEANAGGRQYGEKSMTKGGRLSSNKTLPARSPWMSWDRPSTGLSALVSAARCLVPW
jgi:hypothetical protein